MNVSEEIDMFYPRHSTITYVFCRQDSLTKADRSVCISDIVLVQSSLS